MVSTVKEKLYQTLVKNEKEDVIQGYCAREQRQPEFIACRQGEGEGVIGLKLLRGI